MSEPVSFAVTAEILSRRAYPSFAGCHIPESQCFTEEGSTPVHPLQFACSSIRNNWELDLDRAKSSYYFVTLRIDR